MMTMAKANWKGEIDRRKPGGVWATKKLISPFSSAGRQSQQNISRRTTANGRQSSAVTLLMMNVPKMLPILVQLLLLFLLPLCQGEDCQNEIRARDLLSEDPQAVLLFRNVRFLTFDAQKRPACDQLRKAAIHLPGWLQLLSGEVEVRQPLALGSGSSLALALTLEQDSFWLGRICDQGRAQSAFLSDDFCSLPLCQLLPDACRALAEARPGQTVALSSFFPADGWLPLEPMFNPMLEGHWQAQAELLVKKGQWEEEQELLGRLGVDGWHFVKASEEQHQEL